VIFTVYNTTTGKAYAVVSGYKIAAMVAQRLSRGSTRFLGISNAPRPIESALRIVLTERGLSPRQRAQRVREVLTYDPKDWVLDLMGKPKRPLRCRGIWVHTYKVYRKKIL
jgi:hypothetical protein